MIQCCPETKPMPKRKLLKIELTRLLKTKEKHLSQKEKHLNLQKTQSRKQKKMLKLLRKKLLRPRSQLKMPLPRTQSQLNLWVLPQAKLNKCMKKQFKISTIKSLNSLKKKKPLRSKSHQ